MMMPWHMMDREEWVEILAQRWRMAVPALTVVVALFLMTAPIFTPVPVIPNLMLLALFVWCSFQPALMPAWVAFLIGILADFWLALPLGVNATLLPLVAVLIGVLERRFGHRPFGLDWAIATLVAVLYQLLQWQLLAFADGAIRLGSMVPQVVATALAYPFVAWACAGIQRRWVDAP